MSGPNLQDPIVAIATANGRGGIGVVRISFGGANDSARAIAECITGKKLLPRVATYTQFFSNDGQVVDEGVAIYFPEPCSYTGEAVLELQAHGGQVILQLLLREVIRIGRSIGIRNAQPGEFTKRAYLNNKLNLVQAEAVADLIEASTEEAAKSAARSLRGGLSKEVEKIQEALTGLRVLVEASLDFPDEEIDCTRDYDLFARLKAIKKMLKQALAKAKTGVLLNNGLTVVLTGRPNVGKSSLLNALADDDVAIVSDEEGTTRDRLEKTIHIHGFSVNVIDTAGLRETKNVVEKMGVDRALRAIEEADCILHLIECNESENSSFDALSMIDSCAKKGSKLIRVKNKIDLYSLDAKYVQISADEEKDRCFAEVYLSAKSKIGLVLLKQAILDASGVAGSDVEGSQDVFSARERHIDLLSKAYDYVSTALSMINCGAESIELFAEELRLAQEFLGQIAGQISSDELLGEIFGRFCIGK